MKRKRDLDHSLERQYRRLKKAYKAETSFDVTLPGSSKYNEEIAGKIEFIHMVNFMCHTDLKVSFSSRATFVTGRNGSGKSAIMAALTVALGGSTSLTLRGSKLSDFIKKGESSAKVTISLINEGHNSFKREVYGSRIIICRSISRSGSNGYACKTANGDLVSKKKEEVENIIRALDLQIKNPICVLNQDIARSFLCTTDNALMFSLFTKATQIERLKTTYVKTLDLLALTKEQLNEKKKGMREAFEEIQRLTEKLEQFEKLRKRSRERTRLESEYFWTLVADEKKKLKVLKDKKNQLVNEKRECTTAQTNFENIAKEMEEELKKCETRLQEYKKDKLKKTEVKNRIQKETLAVEKQIDGVASQLRVISRRLERQVAEINGIKENLQKNHNTASQVEAEKVKTKRKIAVLRERQSDLRDEIAEAHRELKRAEDESNNNAMSLWRVDIKKVAYEYEQKRVERVLEETKYKGAYNLLKFGQYTQELMNAIEEGAKENYFHKKPVGPCGVHLRLKGDPKWARAVESVMGGLMCTYLCDNKKDFQKLSAMMERICGSMHPPIIIGKFLQSRHNIKPRKVSAKGFQSLLDVLSFDSDVVFNAFIDQARIETILLFETDQQAASVLTNIQNVPKNLKMGLTLQCDQYFPAPYYRTYTGDSSRPVKFFDAKFKLFDTINRLENELSEVKQAILDQTSFIQSAKEAKVELNKAVDQWKEKLKVLKHEEGIVLVKLNRLRDLEETTPAVMTKVALEEDLQNLEKNRKKSKEEAIQYTEEFQRLKKEKKELVERLNLAAEQEDSADRVYTEFEEIVEHARSKYKKLRIERRETGERLGEISQRLREVEEDILKAKAVVKEKKKEAKKICREKIDTKRSPAEVQKLLKECKKYLKTGKKMAGSRKGTMQEYKASMELFEEMKKTKKVLKKTVKLLKRAASERHENLETFQRLTSNLVSLYFQASLQTRGYDGALKVDFEKKLVDLEMKPKDAAFARKDAKTLSGGERSYATVSFILAVWKAVHMPFYFLDEFDVFMDRLNRTVIIQLLLEHAKTHPNKQFIFITPQPVSGLHLSDTVGVYRLPDPKRNT